LPVTQPAEVAWTIETAKPKTKAIKTITTIAVFIFLFIFKSQYILVWYNNNEWHMIGL